MKNNLYKNMKTNTITIKTTRRRPPKHALIFKVSFPKKKKKKLF